MKTKLNIEFTTDTEGRADDMITQLGLLLVRSSNVNEYKITFDKYCENNKED